MKRTLACAVLAPVTALAFGACASAPVPNAAPRPQQPPTVTVPQPPPVTVVQPAPPTVTVTQPTSPSTVYVAPGGSSSYSSGYSSSYSISSAGMSWLSSNWPTLYSAVASGDSSAVSRAISNSGSDPSYHYRIMSQFKANYPSDAAKLGLTNND